MYKRILSMALVLALIFAVLPAGVLATEPVAVTIGGIELPQGKYLPVGGSTYVDVEPGEGGYAFFNGTVLTFRDFSLERTVLSAEAAISITGDVTLQLEGSSIVTSYNRAALLVDGDLTVTGAGSLRIHGRFNAIHADNFVMAGGTLAASSETNSGGNGITARTAAFRGGTLTVDADYPFFRTNVEINKDPVVSVTPAAGGKVTVWYAFRDGEPLCSTYTGSGAVAIRDSKDMIYHRFWISDQAMETCPAPMEFSFYDLRVAGTYVTEQNRQDVLGDGTVRFDPETNTLTLTDAALTTDGQTIFCENMDLTVELVGSSRLVSVDENPIQVDFGSLTLRGGSLAISGNLNGIFVYGGDLTVDGVELEMDVSDGNGIQVPGGDVSITGCTVRIDADNRAINASGGSMDILNSKVFTRGRGSYGINVAHTLTIDHSTLENYGRPYQGRQDDGTYDNGDDGMDSRNLVIRDSTVKSVGGEDGIWLSGNLQVLRSDVTVIGTQNAIQIKGGPVTVEESTLTAIVQDIGEDPSYGVDIGIYAEKGLIITDSDVTAKSRPSAPAIAVNTGNVLQADCRWTQEEIIVKSSSNIGTSVLTFVDEAGDYLDYVEIRRPRVDYADASYRPVKQDEPAADVTDFADVAETDWFYDEVRDAMEKGLIDGVSDTEFRPDDALTVAQAIKLAAALHQRSRTGSVQLENGADSWYSTYVDYAVSQSILPETYLAYTAGEMNAPITRREFVQIFFGAMPARSYTPINRVADNAISDVKLADAAAGEIYTFYRAGILTGSDEAGTFRAGSTIRRSEAAAILIRMYDTSARQAITLE